MGVERSHRHHAVSRTVIQQSFAVSFMQRNFFFFLLLFFNSPFLFFHSHFILKRSGTRPCRNLSGTLPSFFLTFLFSFHASPLFMITDPV